MIRDSQGKAKINMEIEGKQNKCLIKLLNLLFFFFFCTVINIFLSTPAKRTFISFFIVICGKHLL